MSIITGQPLSQTCPGKQCSQVNWLSGHMTKAVDCDVKHQTKQTNQKCSDLKRLSLQL